MTYTTTATTTAMTFTIEEHIQSNYGGYYMTIGIIECIVCNTSFPSICDGDPGSVEAAVGVSYVCEHPECRAITGAGTLISGVDIEELLSMDYEKLSTMEDAVVECDGYDVEINPILRRREQVEIERRELGWRFAYDMDPNERDETDLDKEKWDNYYNDYNQCGVYVTY